MIHGKRGPFHLQGHRGARGLKPENTLPSFEAALDAGVTSIETDVHLTADGVPVLCHDASLTDRLAGMPARGELAAELKEMPLVSSLTLAEARLYQMDRNSDLKRFPDQDARPTPLARRFAKERGLTPFALPTLADLFAFAAVYAERPGKDAGKTSEQRKRAARVHFDLELKRVPLMPEAIGDTFKGQRPGLLEKKVIEGVRSFNMVSRTIVRSFDHRAVRALKKLEPGVTAAVLIAGTAPVSPAPLARAARAQIYAPDYRFVDAEVIAVCRKKNLTVIPWTVNEPADWERLLAWGADGVTTDYPDRLAHWLAQRHVEIL